MRRHPWLTGVATVVVILAISVALVALKINAVAVERWDEFRRRNDAALQRLRFADATPRSCWDAARQALAALARDMESRPSAPVDDLPGREALLDAIRKAVRTGSSAVLSAPSSDRMDPPELKATLAASALFVSSSRRHREAGDIPAAVEELATGLQLSLDVSRARLWASAWYGASMAQALADEAKALAADPKAGPLLERLATLVDGADRSLPEVFEQYDDAYARLDAGIRQGLDGGGRPYDWEFTFKARHHWYSVRLMAADAMDAQQRVLAVARRIPFLDWPTASAEAGALQAELVEWPNYFVMNMRWTLDEPEKHLRETRARLRAAKAAALQRLGQDATDPGWPVDPFTLKPLVLEGR